MATLVSKIYTIQNQDTISIIEQLFVHKKNPVHFRYNIVKPNGNLNKYKMHL